MNPDKGKKSPKEIIWIAPEFEYRPKDVGWYWMSIIVAAFFILAAIWQKNFLFAIFIIVAEAMMLYWARQLPPHIEFKLDDKGLLLGKNKFHAYEEMSGFSVIEKMGSWELILKTKERIQPFIKISIFENDAEDIKKLLKERLEEMEFPESIVDHISKIIGF